MFQASACDHADATQRRLHRTWTVLRIAEDATGQRFEEKERGRSAREGIGGLGVWGVGMGGGFLSRRGIRRSWCALGNRVWSGAS